MESKKKLDQVSIHLPTSINRILDDIELRNGSRKSAEIRKRLINHMIASDELFICEECGEYMAFSEMSDKLDVCLTCRVID